MTLYMELCIDHFFKWDQIKHFSSIMIYDEVFFCVDDQKSRKVINKILNKPIYKWKGHSRKHIRETNHISIFYIRNAIRVFSECTSTDKPVNFKSS